MGQKHKQLFKKGSRKTRFKRNQTAALLLYCNLTYKLRKFKELVSSLEEDAEISKKKLLELLASFEED